MRGFGRDRSPSLDERVAALEEAVELGEGIVDAEGLRLAGALVQRAGERLGHGVDHTVVALAGATGSGKSSLFNVLAGADLAPVGVRRPTTSTTSACVWGDDASALLDWLAVDRRHQLPAGDAGGGDGELGLAGLVLLDLPDHDSTAAAHRKEVDRIVAVADAVVWVLDPQKYADRAVHERYLRPLAGHSTVLLVTLNQADRLDADALDACRADVHRLLADDGLGDVPLLTTSTRVAGGVEPLRAALAERVEQRRLAVARLEADVTAAAAALARSCGGDAAGGVGDRHRDRLASALADAAGVGTVTDAVARSHRHRAVAATGWPVTRWVRKVRPDPLRRLHLGRGEGTGARTSLPTTSAVSAARLETAVRALADEATGDLPILWSDAVQDEVEERRVRLADRLDAAIAGTDLGTARAPRWWALVGFVQKLLLVAAVVGALWLAALAVLAYLQIDTPEPPDGGPFPVPTILLVVGLLAGVVLAALVRPLAGVGGRRRAKVARRRLEASVRRVAEMELVGPVEGLLARRREYCAAVARASGRSRWSTAPEVNAGAPETPHRRPIAPR